MAPINIYIEHLFRFKDPKMIDYIKDEEQRRIHEEEVVSIFIKKIHDELIHHEIDAPFEDESKQWNLYTFFDIDYFNLVDKSIYQNNFLSEEAIILECVHDYKVFKEHQKDWFIFAYGYFGDYFKDPKLMEFENRIMWSSKDFTKAEVFDILIKIKNREIVKYDLELQREKERWAWEQECFDEEQFGGGSIRNENDEFNEMMDDFDAWGNID